MARDIGISFVTVIATDGCAGSSLGTMLKADEVYVIVEHL
jgi:hypothetical protein